MVCLHCGHDVLAERAFQGVGGGLVLARPGGIFTKRSSNTARFLVCGHCGFAALFAPLAENPLSVSG